MHNDLSTYRKSYELHVLGDEGLPVHPLSLFDKWFVAAEKAQGNQETNAMTLATFGTDGFPKARVVLLKQYSTEGFVFYTNTLSEKGKAIADCNKVCLSFYWPNMEQQIIIKGVAEKQESAKDAIYFASRPRGSKIAAWASEQSQMIASRSELENRVKKITADFSGTDIKKPPFWGGYIVQAFSYEFWQGRKNRMHDRILYHKKESNWVHSRLCP